MKIAITAGRVQKAWHAEELCAQAERAEALGLHSFWLPENHFDDPRAIPSPLTLLAAIAARTSTIKLATTSYLLPIRHPIQAAEEVAVLDQLSGGRVILGVGRGIQDSVFRAFDLDPRTKRARFEQNLAQMQQAWRGEPLQTEGDPVSLAPLPLQQPHPPIWVAAFGKLALRQVGGLGLPYLASPIETLAALERNYSLHREALAEAGHPPMQTVPVMRTVFISENPALCRRVKEKLESSRAEVDDWAIVGDAVYARDKLAEYAGRLSITHLIGGGRLPRIDDAELRRSVEWLAGMQT